MKIHVSVSLINSYLSEIASKDFGISKERVQKVKSVLLEFINWLEEEKDFLMPDEQTLLEAPYTLEVNEII